MPLTGYLSTTDPGRISTICRLEGRELKSYRKKLFLLEPTTVQAGNELYVRVYVRDCPEHDRGGASVPVVLKSLRQGGGFKVEGTAKCCPLCWRILTKPSADFPDPMPEAAMKVLSARQLAALRKGRQSEKRSRRAMEDSPVVSKLKDMFGNGDSFNIREAMDNTGLTRTATLHHLRKMVESGDIVEEKGSAGHGNPSLWHEPWEKEA